MSGKKTTVTRTRQITTNPEVALRAVAQAAESAFKKVNIKANENQVTYTTRITLQKCIITATVEGNTLTMSAKTPAELGATLKVLDEMGGTIDDQGWGDALDKFPGKYFSAKADRADALDTLRPGERIHAFTSGYEDGKGLLIIATDARVILKKRGVFTSGDITIPLDKLSSVSLNKHMVTEEIILTTSNSEIEVEKVPSGSGDVVVTEIRNLMESGPTPSPVPPAGAGVGDLAQLAELHAAGVLTDEEFAAAKAKALGL